MSLYDKARAPWAKLGKPITRAKKAAAAVKEAGLDYDLGLTSVFAGKQGAFKKVPDKQAVVILDGKTKPGVPLSVVGPQFKNIKPVDAFGFMDGVFRDGGARLVTAGESQNRCRIWLLARVPGDIVLARPAERKQKRGEDVTERYLLLTTAHDGSSRCMVIPTTLRLSCLNALPLVMGRDASEFTVSIRHSGNVEQKMKDAAEIVSLAHGRFDHYEDMCKRLLEVDGEPLFSDFIDVLLPNKYDKDGGKRKEAMEEAMAVVLGMDEAMKKVIRERDEQKVKVQTAQRRNTIAGIKLFMDEEPGTTAFDLFQAATGYANHGRTLKVGTGNSEDKRFTSVLFGDAGQFMHKAQAAIEEVAFR